MKQGVNGATVTPKIQNLDKEKLARFLPKGSRREITDEIMANIAKFEEQGIDQAYGEEMLLTHMGVLKEVQVSVPEYIDAVKFCSLVMGGLTAHKAWEIVFPDKAKEVRERNDGELNTSWSTMYNKTKIVTKLMAAMYVPHHLTYLPLNAWAIQKQYNLARGIGAKPEDKVSAHVQHLAAKELYEMTKMPEDNTIQLKIGMDEESKAATQNLADQIQKSAELQLMRLQRGESLKNVQKVGIVLDAEIEDSTTEDD